MAVRKKQAFSHVTLDHNMNNDALGGERRPFEEESGVTHGRLRQARALRKKENESLQDVISRRLLSWTPSLLPRVEVIALAASHDVEVLLTGETGTGKTYLAQLIHEYSPRKDHPFLVVPCGALAANLIQSEFFGHQKGSFTGADHRVGKFAAAGKGTLLLDEIDALGLEQQANLLRVIDTGEYEPVGSNETQHCTARIIVASNWNLEEAVDRGTFRRDLYYRLTVLPLHLPALRERVQDIAPLVRGMTARFNNKFHKNLGAIHPLALAALEAFPWPGNIRQLENVVRYAVLVSTGSEVLLQHLPQPLQEYAAVIASKVQASGDPLRDARERAERMMIQRALVNSGYRLARAAKWLRISRVTLYKKMKKLASVGCVATNLRKQFRWKLRITFDWQEQAPAARLAWLFEVAPAGFSLRGGGRGPQTPLRRPPESFNDPQPRNTHAPQPRSRTG